MKPSEALKLHKEQVDLLFKKAEQQGIVNVRLIGSVSRGEDTDKSDLDLLVSTPGGGKLLKVLVLASELEAVLHKHVDILIEENLPVYLGALPTKAIKYE